MFPFVLETKNFSKFYFNSEIKLNLLIEKKNSDFERRKKKTSIFQKVSNGSENDFSKIEKEQDLTGDKGVVKTLLKTGSGLQVPSNSKVKVHYEGKLENGEIFDSSLDRKNPYVFKIGENKVIKGWEIGIKTMKIGEKAKFAFSPDYGYKKKGIPPIIPPNAKLFFEIELLEILDSNDNSILEVSESNRDIARTPQKIAEDFEKKISKKKKESNEIKFENFFFISPFQSQSGEKAPWWLNPNITFILVFLLILLLFFVVLSVGGIHQGYID